MFLSKQDRDVVSPPPLRLRMQRLMDVPKEMEQEAQGLALIRVAGARPRDSRGLVYYRRDDASALHGAVTAYVHAALVGGVVFRVDVVPARGVSEEGHAADFVGPEGRFGDVLRVEEGGCVGAGVWGEVFGGEVGDGAVTKGAPAEGGGD